VAGPAVAGAAGLRAPAGAPARRRHPPVRPRPAV